MKLKYSEALTFYSSLRGQPAAAWLLLLALAVAPRCAISGQLHYLPTGKPDAIALLTPPPPPGSPEQAADLATVRAVCRAASSNGVTTADTEKKFDVFNFSPLIGAFFQPGKIPRTKAFFHKVQKDAETVTDNAKDFYKRPHPYALDPSLAAGKLEKSFSYPSGHATESMALALVLADLFPDRRDAIIAEARAIGWHRVEIGRHYPTDIYAGQVLARAIVREMKKNPDFQRGFAGAKAEITAARTTANN
jgi:acid phosphatase (class A)